MVTGVRLHASAEDLSKDYLIPYRVATPMACISTQEIPFEELEYGFLIDLLQELQTGAIRKPDHFNNLHFLLLLLYDSHGYPRDRYPLWRWYHRIKKKLLTSKHLTIDTETSRQHILTALEYLIDINATVPKLVEEAVQLEEHYLHSPIHGLFQFYTPLHTYLYMEEIDKPIINVNSKIFRLFQSSILNLYRNEYCDLIHFSIAHKKTSLLQKLFEDKTNWLDASMNLTTKRGWLPLHYASYVGDKVIVQTICNALTSSTLPIHFDAMSLFLPNSKEQQFNQNPNGYILKSCGVDRDIQRTKQRKMSQVQSPLINKEQYYLREEYLQTKFQENIDAKDRPLASKNLLNNSSLNMSNDNDIPDADELELSSLPLIQRDEFIDKILHVYDTKQMLIPSPLILACIATCGERDDYEEIVKILLDSHLVEFDGINHECVFHHVLDYMQRKNYAHFQHVQVYRDTETDGPSAYVFYQFDGFIVNQDVKPFSGTFSGSSATLNTSKNEESAGSDEEHPSEAPISVRCFLTVLVLRDVFVQYPRWDFHLLRETIEEHFSELENALGCRPTILYPDGDVISSRKRSDVTWEVIVRYRLSSETGQSLYMQVDYYFYESFGDPLVDTLANVYQTPFYISCLTDSTVMMDLIFDSFFKRRHLHRWGTVAQKHLEHCFDGVLQIKNNCTTFLSLCTTLSRYYQLDGDPFLEENSGAIQRIFVHAFACCVRRNAKIELDYLIKNHSLIYYDSCRTKPSDIRHNILTYCVVRNLALVFDQLMTNMKTTMYKTYQNSTNPDWQPHIAWKEIIHVIIDPVSQQQQQQNGSNDQNDFAQLACYGDSNTNFASIGSIPILHATGDEYIRCINTRKNLIAKAKRKLPRASSDTKKNRPVMRRMNSLDQQQIKEAISQSSSVGTTKSNGIYTLGTNSSNSGGESLTQRSKNILKNVNRLRWGARRQRYNSAGPTTKHETPPKHPRSTAATSIHNESAIATEAVSLPTVNDAESNEDEDNDGAFTAICPTTPILAHPSKLRRRQTIDTIQGRQYQARRTALQHLRAIFRPTLKKIRAPLDEQDEHEQMPMVTEKRTLNLRRSSSFCENDQLTHTDNWSERPRPQRTHRRSDTVAIM